MSSEAKRDWGTTDQDTEIHVILWQKTSFAFSGSVDPSARREVFPRMGLFAISRSKRVTFEKVYFAQKFIGEYDA